MVGFEFSVVIKFGMAFDTVGIREAIEQKKVEKALNSFALIDTFNGVDEPLITITATIYFDASVSAAIVSVGVKGGITFIVTIDFYDPYPDTSGGLIRPYQLITLGSDPTKVRLLAVDYTFLSQTEARQIRILKQH